MGLAAQSPSPSLSPSFAKLFTGARENILHTLFISAKKCALSLLSHCLCVCVCACVLSAHTASTYGQVMRYLCTVSTYADCVLYALRVAECKIVLHTVWGGRRSQSASPTMAPLSLLLLALCSQGGSIYNVSIICDTYTYMYYITISIVHLLLRGKNWFLHLPIEYLAVNYDY